MYDKSDRGRNSAEQSEHTVSQSSLIALQIGHVFMKLDTPCKSFSGLSLTEEDALFNASHPQRVESDSAGF